LPAIRALALWAGVILFICAFTAAAATYFALSANAAAARSLPQITPYLRLIAVFGIVQVTACYLIWQVFVISRRRFSRRINAVTRGLNDTVFLADLDGTPRTVLAGGDWVQHPESFWLQSIHPDDRDLWPPERTDGQQRVELRLRNERGEWHWYSLRATPVRDSAGRLCEWIGTLQNIHDQKLASEHRDLVIEELRHRMKNLVTVIDALAKNSRRSEREEPGVSAYLQRFLGRLHALATAGELVIASNRVSVEASALVKATLAPFMSENAQRIYVNGPKLVLSEELGSGLGLAVHELATNAIKYGALSVSEGQVSLTWSVTPNGNAQAVQFEWRERGGPPPNRPARSGFGTRMIKHVAVREKSGRVDIDYHPEGLLCRIAFEKDLSHQNAAE
jgi:two-component sensor histidine kinase